ncbi:serine/threonine-protein kinase rio2 [Melia azedarach]|uniref:Serine/threonine-protein kinase rio2 n=1 Tax=Melia azedarach TaxID=155640 RepID=A0ACC1YNY6_MELAZ|nr:serine/threonine-protein kinase rio2 [Melia azedarach]
MNATTTDFVEEINGGSDSETNPDDTPEYYQPISAVDYDDNDSDSDQTNGDESDSHGLPNGYYVHIAENGMSSMHINGDVEAKGSSEDEEEERMREESESESAIMRAFTDDENRRNAPLSQDNAMRVMEAMRGVSLGGLAPDWANQVPEDRWMDQLRRIRRPERATSTNVQN